jgi:hypothetical protein
MRTTSSQPVPGPTNAAPLKMISAPKTKPFMVSLGKGLSNYRTHDKAAAVLQPLTLSKVANRGSQLYNKTKTEPSRHTPPRVERPPSPKRIKLETDDDKDTAAADNKTPPKTYSIPCKSRTKLEYEAALGLILLSSQSKLMSA